MKKLAIITSHPIQYNAPLFKLLANRGNLQIKVFYTWSQAEHGFYDNEFGRQIKWNIPLLNGYNYQFIKNISVRPNSKHFFGIICPDLISKIEDWSPNAIMVYGWAFHAHFKVIRYFKNKMPVFFKGDSNLLDDNPGIKKIFRRLLLKYVYSFIDFAFYVGTNNKKYFINAGLSENQLIYLPYVIDVKLFESNDINNHEKKALKIRESLGIKDTDKVIAFIGKFIKKKNPVFLLKAVKQYNSRNKKQVKLLFVGSGRQEKKLIKLAEKDKNIFFLPFFNQKEMPTAYRIADIFVLPSKGPNETWGISVNEALACNRFVLLSNKVGSAVDFVKNNTNTEVFKSESFDSFLEKLNLFLKKDKFETTSNKNILTLDDISLLIEKKILEK